LTRVQVSSGIACKYGRFVNEMELKQRTISVSWRLFSFLQT